MAYERVGDGHSSRTAEELMAAEDHAGWVSRSRVCLTPMAAPSIMGLFGFVIGTVMLGAYHHARGPDRGQRGHRGRVLRRQPRHRARRRVAVRDLGRRGLAGRRRPRAGELLRPSSLQLVIAVHAVVQRGGEFVELRQMCRGELRDELVALVREFHPHDAGVVGVRRPANDAGGFGAVHESDRAVALQQQVLGDLADRRRPRSRMALDRHQKLMLRGRESRLSGLLLAPAQEAPERDAEVQVLLEILFGRGNGVTSFLLTSINIVARSRGSRSWPSLKPAGSAPPRWPGAPRRPPGGSARRRR